MARGIITNIYRNSTYRRPFIDLIVEKARKLGLYKTIDSVEFSQKESNEPTMCMESVEGAFAIVKFLDWASDYRGEDRDVNTIWVNKKTGEITSVTQHGKSS